MTYTRNNSSKGSAVLLLVVLVVVALAGAGFYLMKTNPSLFKLTPGPAVINTPVDTNQTVVVNFTYKVKSITKDEIVISGDKGDFKLPNDASKVTIYKGPTTSSPVGSITDLKVGSSVNMEFVPGKSASLFLSVK